MPDLDMNAEIKRDPVSAYQRLATSRAGQLRVAKEERDNARDSVERDRAAAKVKQAKADVRYFRELAKEAAMRKEASGIATID